MSGAGSGLNIGLCSVTLRQRTVGQILDIADAAGLDCVEWGADTHVLPDDPAMAADVARRCHERGVAVASYGSYYRAGVHDGGSFRAVVTAAAALGAPRIRIWAGGMASEAAAAADRRAVADAARSAAVRAADLGIDVAFEFHGGTLTDTVESTLRLLDDVDHPGIGTYWQPALGLGDAAAVDCLRRLLPRVAAVHAFSWWPGSERLPLAARESLWREVVAALSGLDRQCDVLLEFVRGDDPEQLVADAATLTRIIDQA